MSVLVKICGLRDEETLQAALDASADFVGFVFYPPSPRFVHFFQAARLAEIARGKAKIVALMVDPEDIEIEQVINDVRPDYIQLHGSEHPSRVEEIVDKFQIDVIKAIAVEAEEDVKQSDAFSSAELILFDAKPQAGCQLPGGNGIAFDWRILDGRSSQSDYMLSGGLTPQNVAEAIRLTNCKMVDVSSGVEERAGVKDCRKISSFIRAAKGNELS